MFNDDGEALMSGRDGIIMSHFAEVVVQRLIKKDFSFTLFIRILLGGTNGPNDCRSILSTIFGTIWTVEFRYLGQEGRFLDPK